jgi:hypothetical protein
MNLSPFLVDWSQSQPDTVQSRGLASDSVAVATLLMYHFVCRKTRGLARKIKKIVILYAILTRLIEQQ